MPLPASLPQIGFEKQWLAVIQRYVVPMQAKVFPGYHSKVCDTYSQVAVESCKL